METPRIDLHSYDHYIVAFSGGKDSLASLLVLLDNGVPKSKIELWHHLVDGREGSDLMDWPITEDYCRKVAKHFEIPIFFSWKERGFEGEMTRNNQPTAPNHFQYPQFNEFQGEYDDNLIECGLSGGKGTPNTRMKFPQVSADLRTRWCSAYLKIDVCTASINNQKRFWNSRTLVISGERAKESPSRARYKEFEPDRTDNRYGKTGRLVDHWRPVHQWSEHSVWRIIKRYGINPHPAYRLGWGRLSCMFCIFGSKHQWSSARKVNHSRFTVISDYEREFEVTIQRDKSVEELAEEGTPYEMDEDLMRYSQETEFTEPVYLYREWKLPNGAFQEDQAGSI